MLKSVCAIVGAGEGLGRALAAKFAAEGHNIALLSRSKAGSQKALEAAQLANHSVQVAHYVADAMRPVSIEHALEQVEKEFGQVDVLIYNVRDSFKKCEPLAMSYDDLDQSFRLEVLGAFAAAKAVMPGMRARGYGSVMFSSATAAFRGSSVVPLYAIGKFGLRALSQSLAKAYAKDGVHVVHVRLDCDLDSPIMRELYGERFNEEQMGNPDAVAETYWWAHQQPKSAWSNEIELRPFTETWTY